MPTYDIVDQGADPTGDTEIDTILENLIESNTTILFPSGTYKLNELVVQPGTDSVELIAPEGARLVPGQQGDNVRWIDVYSHGFVLDGFELDMREIALPPFIRMNYQAGDWELRRLITRDKVRAATDANVGSNNSSDGRTYFRLSSAADTRGLLQDCYFHEGACASTEAGNRRAILVESGKGELVFNRCWFENWAENTIYAKKPEGALKIYNCFFRNTQNGMRLGGNSEVRNCVSIKDSMHPIQGWSGGSLQRGVNAEAVAPTDVENGIDSYNGTLTIADSDFYHRNLTSSCGGPITAPAPCERIDIQNVRISYESTKSHDAIYTREKSIGGTPLNLAYLQLQNVHVTNDHPRRYAISIGQVPDEWGTVSGVLGGSGAPTDSEYIASHMTVGGDPNPPDTTPPLSDPPILGEIPSQSAQVVRIDNTGNESSSSYEITAGTTVLPAGNDGATVTMTWGADDSPVRPPESQQATGTIPAGEIYAFYVTGGIVSTSASGPATWTVDSQPYNPGAPLVTNTVSNDQRPADSWHQAETGIQQTRVISAKPLSYNGGQPTHTRLQNVNEGHYEYKLEEWEYLDGGHTSETFYTLAVEPTEQMLQLADGSSYSVKAGTVSASTNFVTESLGNFFGSNRPVVLAQSQTYNGPDPIVTRVTDVSSDSFSVGVQEEEANGGHTSETVGYIALQEASGQLNDTLFEVQRTEEVVTDEWYQIDFQQRYNTPQFTAAMQTFNGIDTAGLRYRNLTGTSVQVKVEEEQSADTETTHAPEAIGYAVFEGSV
jgi:hypothetical protein